MNSELAENLINDFRKVCDIAGVELNHGDVSYEVLAKPHRPPSKIPPECMAVYMFFYEGRALKVGKAGPKSQARYTSQHYNPNSAPSTLAASLLKDSGSIGISGLTAENVGTWIKQHTDRINFCLSTKQEIFVLTLLESFLQCRLKPVFEGFASQR